MGRRRNSAEEGEGGKGRSGRDEEESVTREKEERDANAQQQTASVVSFTSPCSLRCRVEISAQANRKSECPLSVLLLSASARPDAAFFFCLCPVAACCALDLSSLGRKETRFVVEEAEEWSGKGRGCRRTPFVTVLHPTVRPIPSRSYSLAGKLHSLTEGEENRERTARAIVSARREGTEEERDKQANAQKEQGCMSHPHSV